MDSRLLVTISRKGPGASRNGGERVALLLAWRSVLMAVGVVMSRRLVNRAPFIRRAASAPGSSIGSVKFLLVVIVALVPLYVVLGCHMAVAQGMSCLVTVVTHG